MAKTAKKVVVKRRLKKDKVVENQPFVDHSPLECVFEKNGTWDKYEVGEVVLIKHYSKEQWVEATIKRITLEGEKDWVLHFYIPNPGFISLPLTRIKKIVKKQVRIKKSTSTKKGAQAE